MVRYTRRLQQRADAFGLVHFCGTNTTFFLPAVRDCLGFVTGVLSEDTPTGLKLAQLGWDAYFVDQALAVGTVGRALPVWPRAVFKCLYLGLGFGAR